MPTLSRFYTETLLYQVEKRDYAGEKGIPDSDEESPVALLGLVVAALTLLVGIVSLRSSRFRCWLSHLLPSQLVTKTSGITLLKPAPAGVATVDLHAIPFWGIPIPAPVFIYSDCSNAHPADKHSNIFPQGHGCIIGEGGRVPQGEELPEPRRLEPAVPKQARWK
ncbi:unnamed protein product [Tuber aestivum]|uniref:Uncharacterized protein n=1 Tax=Tuber aestivum TaxID=59557 RepID=A0A292PY10_9PEZI|nr:unnamed protein product [Tuber aestivum]